MGLLEQSLGEWRRWVKKEVMVDAYLGPHPILSPIPHTMAKGWMHTHIQIANLSYTPDMNTR